MFKRCHKSSFYIVQHTTHRIVYVHEKPTLTRLCISRRGAYKLQEVNIFCLGNEGALSYQLSSNTNLRPIFINDMFNRIYSRLYESSGRGNERLLTFKGLAHHSETHRYLLKQQNHFLLTFFL